jgi:anti-sigma regulatory factor (Ser/Thr protein kinase)
MSGPNSTAAAGDASPDGGDPPPFSCSQNPADAHTAAHARTEFSTWLRRYCHLGTTVGHDVLLAVNEALANAVEHAYAGTSGNVDLAAGYDVNRHTLSVTVEDHGQWIPPAPVADARYSQRGRGFVLMRALADEFAVDSSAEGTRVCLTWRDLAHRPA